MAIEFKTQTLTHDCIHSVAHAQTAVRCSVQTHDRGGCSKILSITATAQITSVEALKGEGSVYGRVCYKLLYLDGEGRPCGLDYYCDYDLKLPDERVAPAPAEATCTVVECESELSHDTISLTALVDVELSQLVKHERTVLVDADCERRTQTVHLTHLTPLREVTFEVTEEIESAGNVDRILLFDARAHATSVRPTAEGCVVEGTLACDVVYLCEGEIVQLSHTLPFSEEVEGDQDVEYHLFSRSQRLVVSGEEGHTLRIEAVLSLSGYRIATPTVEVLADAFHPEVCLSAHADRFLCRQPTARISERFELTHHAALPAPLPAPERILVALPSRLNLANLIPDVGTVTVEGVLVASLVYRTAEGATASAEIEIPFSKSFPAPTVCDTDILTGELLPCGMSATVTGGAVRLSATLVSTVRVYTPQCVDFIETYTETPRTPSKALISLYFAGPEDTLWTVAHATGTAPSRLLSLNPDLADLPTLDGKKILIYRGEAK
ncbi:MAG: DUF3794 domain-containing protein [Clostridia bacterium]|nr:DUF3794 domain-containing protein [Clostridia bacterium]